jgi:hypothetical protein
MEGEYSDASCAADMRAAAGAGMGTAATGDEAEGIIIVEDAVGRPLPALTAGPRADPRPSLVGETEPS